MERKANDEFLIFLPFVRNFLLMSFIFFSVLRYRVLKSVTATSVSEDTDLISALLPTVLVFFETFYSILAHMLLPSQPRATVRRNLIMVSGLGSF